MGQQCNVVRVNGMEGARAYMLPPNSMAILFDNDEDVFYAKSTDGAGFPDIRVFDYVERKVVETPPGEFATRQELEDMSRKLDEIMEVLHGKQPVQQTIPSV